MSSFGENYKKNNLLDDIQHFFSEGGTIEEMFDVLRYIFEYGKTPLDDLIKENRKLKKQLEEKENQQKEFIEWLEKESKELIRGAGYHQRICLDILEKYKEIIGGKE